METNLNNLTDQIQEGNTNQLLPFHTHNGVDSPIINISESSLNLSDITTGDSTTSRHGLLPKLSGVVTEFLDGTGDFDTVKDSDLSTSDITDNNVSTSKHGFAPKAPNNTTTFLRGDASWAAPQVSVIEITVNAGETLSIGEVVRLYTATGSYANDGYDMVNGTIYAVRAAANDTTYGPHVLGVMTSNATYLGSGTCAVVGSATGLSGLTANTRYYLSNYTGTSAVSISQTTSDSNYILYDPSGSGSIVLQQIFIPTSSRIDKIGIKASKNGGFSGDLTFTLYRSNTSLYTTTLAPTAGSTPAEVTIDLTDVRVYKGELLRFTLQHTGGVPGQTEGYYIAYQATGDVYAPVYGPTGSAAGNDFILLSGNSSGTGTISSSGTAVTGSGTSFTTQLRIGQCIIAGGQTRVITAITDNTNLTVGSAFSPDVSASAFSYGLPASGADIWFKVYEYPDFGKLGTSAGTRKYKMGHSLSTTNLVVNIQEGDSIL